MEDHNGNKMDDIMNDNVVLSLPIVLMPVHNGTFNRLQFQTYEAAQMDNCSAKFKKNVKHLQVVQDQEEVEQEEGYHDYFHVDENDKLRSDQAVYQGEAFLQDGIVNHALGFIRNGKVYIVPIQDIYDMQHLMPDNKAEMSIQSKIDESKLYEKEPEVVAAPVRVKFGRTESDFRKKKREQSSQHKQKLIDEDPWLPLNVDKGTVGDFINSTEKATDKKIKVETA